MTQKVIYKTSLVLGPIMCFDACGTKIDKLLRSSMNEAIQEGLLPSDAELIMESTPQDFGFYEVALSVASHKNLERIEEHTDKLLKMLTAPLYPRFLQVVPQAASAAKKDNPQEDNPHRFNLWINFLSICAISILSIAFPPSLLLTVGLTSLSVLTTAFTAREYLLDFFHQLKTRTLFSMSTTISLGWFLSLTHTLLHVISMPLMTGFSMIVMNFIMPIGLIACMNAMDEIKHRLQKKAREMHLSGLDKLFPQMSGQYASFPFPKRFLERISTQLSMLSIIGPQSLINSIDCKSIEKTAQIFLSKTKPQTVEKSLLKKGMVIRVNAGECFPVDCNLLDSTAVIDASLLTGEPYQSIKCWANIPAGAINLGQTVHVYTTQDSYHSTVNRLLYPSNRRLKETAPEETPLTAAHKFIYFYAAVVILSLLAAIVIPATLGVATLPMLLKNTLSILFSICPCTIAIAHELPKLMSLNGRRQHPGLILRNETLIDHHHDDIHTIVFDKTGTLTTGSSFVESSDIPLSTSLWEKIYLLEKMQGNNHPISQAIQEFYRKKIKTPVIFDDVKDAKTDVLNQGLEGTVQGKQLLIGSATYLQSKNVTLRKLDQTKMMQGLTPIYVAENGIHKGTLYIGHTLRKNVSDVLLKLKQQDIELILLTGDTQDAALAFNQQVGNHFSLENIHGEQSSDAKKDFLNHLMNTSKKPKKGIWFIGDGLNDGSCCRIVTEKGGISCSMNAADKSTFFTDLSLNNSLAYLLKHKKLNHQLWQNIHQNQGILTQSMLTFLVCIVSFSLTGIAIPSLIPTAIMLATTLFTLFNAYRMQLATEVAFSSHVSWSKKILSTNFSLRLLLTASMLLTTGIVFATCLTGAFTLPFVTFSAGVALSIASVCSLSALSLLGTFALLFTAALLTPSPKQAPSNLTLSTQQEPCTLPSCPPQAAANGHSPEPLNAVTFEQLPISGRSRNLRSFKPASFHALSAHSPTLFSHSLKRAQSEERVVDAQLLY